MTIFGVWPNVVETVGRVLEDRADAHRPGDRRRHGEEDEDGKGRMRRNGVPWLDQDTKVKPSATGRRSCAWPIMSITGEADLVLPEVCRQLLAGCPPAQKIIPARAARRRAARAAV